MDLAPDLAELALDRRVHVLVGGIDRVDRRELLGHLGELRVVEDPGLVQAAACSSVACRSYGSSSASSARRNAHTSGASPVADASGPERQIDHPSCASIARASWMSLICTASWPIRSAAVKAVALRSMLSRSGS